MGAGEFSVDVFAVADLLPPAEPNWLLATLATSSATLIAVIGGLLVARFVSRESDVDSAIRRLTVAEAATAAARNEADRAHAAKLREDARDFLRRALSDIVLDSGIVTVEELVARHEWSEHSVDELRPFVESATIRVRVVYKDILSRIGGHERDRWPEDWPTSWFQAERLHGIRVPPGEEYLHERIWEALWQSRATEKRDEEIAAAADKTARYIETRHASSGGSAGGPEPSAAPASTVEVGRRWAKKMKDRPVAAMPPRREERLEELSDRLTHAQDAVTQREAEEARARGDATAPRTSPDTWWAIAILGYFAAIGVVLPLCLMAGTPTHLPGFVRYGLALTFTAGLAGLIILLVASARSQRTVRKVQRSAGRHAAE